MEHQRRGGAEVSERVAAVVPTCRGWKIPWQTIPVDWIIVHDREQAPISVEEPDDDDVFRRGALSRPKIEANLIHPDPLLYGEKTSAIRQAGLDYAYLSGYDYVLTVDDDCVLPDDWAESHRRALDSVVGRVWNTVPGAVIRGVPNSHVLPVGISHGLWSGVLDYPAWYQLKANPGFVTTEDKGWSPIAAPFPMCGMNVGFRREVLPAVYFQHKFLRHDDIFAGWFAQKVLGDFNFGFMNGSAVVRHERASNATANLAKETPGDVVNIWLLEAINEVVIPEMCSIQTAFLWVVFNVSEKLKRYRMRGEEWSRLEAMLDDAVAWAQRGGI
jgi:hypothetical protein